MALPHAIAMLDKGGVLSGITRALRYAGENGRLATLPEIVSARVEGVPGSFQTWFSSASSFHFGYSRRENPIIIVAHGDGPLMDARIRRDAYQNRTVERNHDHFATLTRELFLSLESGRYGTVSVLDATPYLSTYVDTQGCLSSRITLYGRDASHPLAHAIFGKDYRAYFEIFAKRERENYGLDIEGRRVGEIKFEFRFSPELYWANFLALELVGLGANLCDRDTMTRFVAVRDKERITKIVEAPRLSNIAERLKDVQSESDKLRHEVAVLVEMEEGGVL